MALETNATPNSVRVRNRRLQKMRNLMKEGEYFSMESMEVRAPLLYYEHIGKFEEQDGCDGPQSNSSDECRRKVAAPRCQDLGEWRQASGVGQALADFLLHGIDRQEIRKRRERESEKQKACEEEEEEEEEEMEEETEGTRTKGMDEDDATPAASAKREQEERKMLRQEFVQMMQQRFLAAHQGKDGEYFDYRECDSDADMDDLVQMGLDAEDDYFKDSDDDAAPALSRAERMARLSKASRGGGPADSDQAGYEGIY